MDPALHQNQAEFAVLVFAVCLQVLSHGYSLLDQVVKILWNLRSQTKLLHYSQNLAVCDSMYLWNTVLVTQKNSYLRRREALLCHLGYEVGHLHQHMRAYETTATGRITQVWSCRLLTTRGPEVQDTKATFNYRFPELGQARCIELQGLTAQCPGYGLQVRTAPLAQLSSTRMEVFVCKEGQSCSGPSPYCAFAPY